MPARTLTAIAALAVLLAPASAQRSVTPAVTELLDTYARGQFEAAVAKGAAVPNLAQFSAQYFVESPKWLAAAPDQARRRAYAAAFVLELTHARMESDWKLLRELVERTCMDFRAAGPPDAFEREWHLAALALAGRARDRTWLLGDVPALQFDPPRRQPQKSTSPTHIRHAVERVPNDPRMALEWVVAWTWGRDRETPRNMERSFPVSAFGRSSRQLEALAALVKLKSIAPTAAEARLRSAQLHLVVADFKAAVEEATEALKVADVPEAQYVGHILQGRAFDGLGERARAIDAYEQALKTIPGAESAAIALTALGLGEGRAPAPAIVDRALVRKPDTDDPWRLFPYGSFRYWPARLRALREALPK